MPRTRKKKRRIGWREWVGLPDFGIPAIKAKVDTGARTSALHAFRLRVVDREEGRFAEFYVHPVQRHRHPEVFCSAPVTDERWVTSSNGVRQKRIVVETRLRLDAEEWPIELTLTNRDEMGFRMLLGRHAIKRRYVVDPGTSYRMGRPEQDETAIKRSRRKPRRRKRTKRRPERTS